MLFMGDKARYLAHHRNRCARFPPPKMLMRKITIVLLYLIAILFSAAFSILSLVAIVLVGSFTSGWCLLFIPAAIDIGYLIWIIGRFYIKVRHGQLYDSGAWLSILLTLPTFVAGNYLLYFKILTA